MTPEEKKAWELANQIAGHGIYWTPVAWAVVRGFIKALPHLPDWLVKMIGAMREIRKFKNELKAKNREKDEGNGD